MLEQTTKMNLLYDFYGSLLTEKQQSLLELYYLEDWSLSEIAEHQGTSRQAVFEAIKRAQVTLTDLENKLSLVTKHRTRQELIAELRTQLDADANARAVAEPIITRLLEID
ncbi:YlxM family DNA-binding protein [Baia soyae]|uniref:UPF0122 protein EDD57_101117 n=1 Tax=Baia soyae TaxID=1544746 RepID=A0A4R2S3Q9_9BACL|nr:putative DNA-binding protein [Baia soyae]TCP70674.1 hypothetical protein EDD57_101117 [Baia soyae]